MSSSIIGRKIEKNAIFESIPQSTRYFIKKRKKKIKF